MKLYVIDGQDGCFKIGHYKDTPKHGVLVYGDKVDLFTYSSARRAIRRTENYAIKKHLPWDLYYKIKRVNLQPNSTF
jgi:hypothetical protein